MFVTKLFSVQLTVFLLCFKGTTWAASHCNFPEESAFPCDSGGCTLHSYWCDGGIDCSDGSDEQYCPRSFRKCRTDMFKCKTIDMCIPEKGYCDGKISCPDGSDEKNCSCEDRENDKGIISRQIQVGRQRSYHECWKFHLEENEELTVTVHENLHNRECMYGNITFYIDGGYFTFESEEIDANVHTICSSPPTNVFVFNRTPKTFTFTNDVKIRYLSYFPTDESGTDIFNISYSKINLNCLNPEMFKCSEISCVSPEKQCDGIKDCENGLDEKNCDFDSLSEVLFEYNRKHAPRWMRSQHDADWGWKANTARAVVALYLSNDLHFNATSHEDDLIAKQLELEVSTFLLRHTFEKASIPEMATYINALQAICHNPKNFYGFDLVQQLKEEIEGNPNVTPSSYLTLCNAKETVSEGAVNSLLEIIGKTSNFGFALEVQALSSMALSCLSRSNQYSHLKQNLTEHLNKIKKEQKEDGSFGNEYTTALVIQALIANNQSNDRDWNFKAAAEYLKKLQKLDGSFGDFLTAYLIMPLMNGKSLVDLGRVNCTKSQTRPREGNAVSDIKNRLGGRIPVKYSIIIGDDKDQILPILLRTPENITVLELMALAADIDPKYEFKSHKTKEKTYVYEISKIPNDPEKNKFWFLYRQNGNDTEQSSNQSPDEVYVGENHHMIMWYRTLIM